MNFAKIAAFSLIISATLSVAQAQDYPYNNSDYQSTDQLFPDPQQPLDQTTKDVWDNSGDSLGDLKGRYDETMEGLSGVYDRTTHYIENTLSPLIGGTSAH